MTLVRICSSLPILLSVSLLVGCDQNSVAGEQATPRPVKVVMAAAEQDKVPSLPGVVRARIETDLAFRTLGRMVSRKVDVGDLVHKGDVLAEIDPLSLQLAVKSAEADLRNAQAQLENAATTETRKRRLVQNNAASIADHDLAEQQLKSATANAARATASLAKANEQLGYSELRAEFDGVVTATFVEMGQTVSAGQPVLKLARLEQRDVVVDVPEAQFSNIRLDDRFNVAL
ncbi:MAG: efflux RND transporter periplasmic adaptor subunit, partial [Rhizobium sp.]|uniref:efflux RND transporter periplasmic adaptor subunit n=1 Tax=Rhizobium sp. TaxID=391 RepID=UPI0030F1342F